MGADSPPAGGAPEAAVLLSGAWGAAGAGVDVWATSATAAGFGGIAAPAGGAALPAAAEGFVLPGPTPPARNFRSCSSSSWLFWSSRRNSWRSFCSRFLSSVSSFWIAARSCLRSSAVSSASAAPGSQAELAVLRSSAAAAIWKRQRPYRVRWVFANRWGRITLSDALGHKA